MRRRSRLLRWNGGNLKRERLLAKLWMSRGQPHGTGLFLGADPDRSGAADHCEWIVADQLGWSLEMEFHGVVGERTNRTEFVGDAQHDARRIGAVSKQLRVVWKQREFLIDPAARHRLFDNFLASDIALDAQIAPIAHGFSELR